MMAGVTGQRHGLPKAPFFVPDIWFSYVGLKAQHLFSSSQSNLSGDTFSIDAPQKSSKNKKNILRTFPLVRNFPLKVAANLLEHSFGAFI